MSQLPSRFLLSCLSAILLVSCSAAPVAQVNNPAKPAVTAPSQEQLKNLQVKLMDDDNFAASFEKDPKAALKAQGIGLADSEQVKVLQIGNKMYMVLDDRNLQTFHANLLNQPDSEKSNLQKLLDIIRVQANNDTAFKARLLSQTAETLKAEGVDETVAGQFEVVDYQPNTSLLMVAPLGTELNRGVGDDVKKYFKGLPDKLADALGKALDTLKSLSTGTERSISKTAVSAAADGLVVVSTGLCVATIGLVPFFCNDGKDKNYWVTNINAFLSAQKYLLNPVNLGKIKQLETAIKQADSDLAQVQATLVTLNADRKKLEQEGNNTSLREIDMKIKTAQLQENTLKQKLAILKIELAEVKKG